MIIKSAILFGALILSLMIAPMGSNQIFAEKQNSDKWTEENAKKWDKLVEKAIQDNAKLQGNSDISASSTFWTSSNDCTHTAISTNHCKGWNVNGEPSFVGLFNYETPY